MHILTSQKGDLVRFYVSRCGPGGRACLEWAVPPGSISSIACFKKGGCQVESKKQRSGGRGGWSSEFKAGLVYIAGSRPPVLDSETSASGKTE